MGEDIAERGRRQRHGLRERLQAAETRAADVESTVSQDETVGPIQRSNPFQPKIFCAAWKAARRERYERGLVPLVNSEYEKGSDVFETNQECCSVLGVPECTQGME